MQTFNLIVNSVAMEVESRGVSVSVNVADIPHDILRQVLLHGIKQKISDSASNAAMNVWKATSTKPKEYKPLKAELEEFAERHRASIQQETLALMEKAKQSLLDGKWQIREGNGTSSKWTEEQSLALEYAKDDLLPIFKAQAKKRNVKPTFKNLLALGGNIAAFFTESKAGLVSWNDEVVMKFVASQLASGKADYAAKAREELARQAELAAEVPEENLDELFGDMFAS